MRKVKVSKVLIIGGLLLMLLGFFLAPQPMVDRNEIRDIYDCDRLTDEYRATDKYCSDPYSAPEMRRNLSHPAVYIGFASFSAGSFIFLLKPQNLKRSKNHE